MDLEKFQLESTDNPNPPPDYSTAMTNIGQAPPSYSQNSPTGAPFQASGFQSNTPGPSEWYIGVPGSGLNLFDGVEEVAVERMVDLMEAVITVNPSQLKRQFRVLNKDGQQMFFLQEDESLLSIHHQRAYHVLAKDSYGETVFEVRRDTEKCTCCYCCTCIDTCRSEAEVIDSKAGSIGFLKQRCHLTPARFALEDSRSTELMTISGANLCLSPPSSYEFNMTNDGSRGCLVKIGSSWGTALNKYTMKFPPNVNAQIKACCIGTLIHFDFRFHIIPQRHGNV